MRRLALLTPYALVFLVGCADKAANTPRKSDTGKDQTTREADARADLDKLQGDWSTASVAQGNALIPDEEARKYKLTVKGNQYTLTNGDVKIEGTLKLDPSRKPNELDAVRSQGLDAGKTIKAIYKLEGDTFEVCLGGPAGERPKDFDGGVTTYIHKRAKQ